ncbi:MAG: hypothetical protein K2W95_20995 [Candidatus Obscuribacterales bacterium]|nr:hypothetical protein [Candidatus Obscuribacterales bacterium]
MHPEKISLTTAPSNLLDSHSQTLAEEFARSAVWGGLQAPLLGAAQVIDKTLDTDLQKTVQFMSAPTEAQSNGRWHAQQLGTMAGMAIPFLLLHKIVGVGGNQLRGTLEKNAPVACLTKRTIQESVATGMLFDGLFRPLTEEQMQNNFFGARAKNALIGGITFGALTGTSIGIKSVMRTHQGLAANLVRSEIGSTMLAGIPAGIINAELTSRLYTGQRASLKQVGQSVYNFAVLGATMTLGKRFVATPAESDLSHRLGSKTEAATKLGPEKIAQAQATGENKGGSADKAPPSAAVEKWLAAPTVEAASPAEPQLRAPSAEVTAEVVSVRGGGSIKLLSDGSAIVNTPSVAGAEAKLNYRSMGEDRVGSEYFLLFDLKPTPSETAASISMFVRCGKTTPVTIESSLGCYAEPWTKWQPTEIAALDSAIPTGSVPIGVGVRRQAWLTPDKQIVVIGPAQPRPDCPFLRTPFKVEKPGTKQIEFFEYADPRGITYSEVKCFDAAMRAAGWEVKDSKPMNYVRSADGKMWRVDPDDVYRR